MIAVGILLLLYTDGTGSIIFLGVTLVIQIFVSYHVVYLHDLTPIAVGADILIIMIWISAAVLLLIAMVYVTDLNGELSFTNSENKKLLDTIHEGLLVYTNEHSDDFDSPIM